MAVNLHMPGPAALGTPGAAQQQFRSPTVSPRGTNRMDMTPPPSACQSPLRGPSRRSQLTFPSYDPAPFGTMPNKALSYTGPPPRSTSTTPVLVLEHSKNDPPRSPRMVTQSQMQHQPGSSQSLQAHRNSVEVPPSRYSMPGGGACGLTPPPHVSEEVVFFPSYTPRQSPGRRSGMQAPTGAHSNGPRRTSGCLVGQRQFGTNVSHNVSPRFVNRELKLSLGGDPSHYSYGDKENRENILEYSKDDRDNLVKRLREENAELSAKNAEQSVKLAENQQAIENSMAKHGEYENIHERLRMDLEESSRRSKQKEATEQQLRDQHQQMQKEIQQLREENRLNQSELRKSENRAERDKEERKELQERCNTLETQNAELQQQLRNLERRHADSERSRSMAEREKLVERGDKDAKFQALEHEIREQDAKFQALQANFECRTHELREKDKRIVELERHMRDKDHHLHEKECLIHDKDQNLQEQKHEQQKRDAAWQSQIHDLQAELSLAEKQATARRADDKDFRHMKQTLQDKKDLIENLQTQLRRISAVTGLVTPGEYARLQKSEEAKNGFVQENDQLRDRNNDLETESRLIRKELALLRRRLPAEVCETIACEAMSCVVADDEKEDEAAGNCRSRLSSGSRLAAR